MGIVTRRMLFEIALLINLAAKELQHALKSSDFLMLSLTLPVMMCLHAMLGFLLPLPGATAWPSKNPVETKPAIGSSAS